MAYKTEELEKTALEAIKKHKLIWIEEVVTFLPCSAATFYNHELEKLETIKKAIQDNRINQKVKMRKKWYDSDNATLNMAAYKLLASDNELERLTTQNNKNDNKHSGGINVTLNIPQSDIEPYTSEKEIIEKHDLKED